MKALTIRQPWAWAIIFDGKDVENRSWNTSYRGDLAIHAGVAYRADAWLPRGIVPPSPLRRDHRRCRTRGRGDKESFQVVFGGLRLRPAQPSSPVETYPVQGTSQPVEPDVGTRETRSSPCCVAGLPDEGAAQQ